MDVSIIGSGNLAYHMMRMLSIIPTIKLVAVCSTSKTKAKSIIVSKQSKALSKLTKLPSSDLIIICVSDDKIYKVSKELATAKIASSAIVVHASGSVDSSILKHHSKYGVLYPLQTFTKGIELNYSNIPFLISANKKTVISTLTTFANEISSDVRVITDDQRKDIHLSAVLSNNMINHIIYLAQQRLTKNDISADVLHCLIEETIRKTTITDPFNAQTGPARRGDKATIQQHLAALKGNKQLQEIYSTISDSIFKTYTK